MSAFTELAGDTKEILEAREALAKKEMEIRIQTNVTERVLHLTGIKPQLVHAYPLYGALGSVSFGEDYHFDKAMPLTELLQVLYELPPVAMLKSDNRFMAKWDNKYTVSEINPHIIKLEGCTRDIAKVSWYTELFPNEIFKIHCSIQPPHMFIFGQTWAEYRLTRGGNESKEIVNTRMSTPLKNHKYMKWARGSNEYKHDYTLYTEDMGFSLVDYVLGHIVGEKA